MQIESIKILDCTTYDCWIVAEDIPNRRCRPIIVQGRVIYEDKEQITVSLMSDEAEECHTMLAVIPKGAIVERKMI